MMLKKQTVWLLTMLSLVVVLSVYYITAEPVENDNLANVDVQEEEDKQNADGTIEKSESHTIVQDVSKDEVFEEIRLQIQDERSKKLEELQQAAGSADLMVCDEND